MSTHTYRLKYDLDMESGEFTAEHLRNAGVGGTDALIVISCLYPEDGSYSQQIFSFDGRNDKDGLSPNDLFKAWMIMGMKLADRGDVPGANGQLLDFFANSVREAFASSSECH